MGNLLEEILKLSRTERIQLAEAIWDSTITETPPHYIDAADEEVWFQEKMAKQSASPEKVRSWEETKSRILKRL